MGRIYLSALLIAMAAGQLLDMRGFVEVLDRYRLGMDGAAWPLGAGLIAGELGAAALMLGPRRWRHEGAGLALVVAVAWTVLAVQAFLRGLQIDNCGCFGVYLGQQLRWYVLVQDAAFIAIAVWVWRGTGRANGAPGHERRLPGTAPATGAEDRA
jgi:hypothetical protein